MASVEQKYEGLSHLTKWVVIVCALLAFAGNSVLCRLALGNHAIDAMSFTAIRLTAGVVVMLLIVCGHHQWRYVKHDQQLQRFKQQDKNSTLALIKSGWLAPLMLFMYALCFSLAYVTLDTGIGALILFASVQLTMIVVGVLSGQRISGTEIIGMLLAFLGFVYLLLPSLSTPSFFGFVLMAGAGVAWGVYTLQGRASSQPILDTAFNFTKTLPFVLAIVLINIEQVTMSTDGLWLAVISGAITSGIGYTLWYVVLPHLSITQAAVLQLLVPIIAALGGVVFADESITKRLLMAALLVLGGILLVIFSRRSKN